jgi:hypothetical protein
LYLLLDDLLIALLVVTDLLFALVLFDRLAIGLFGFLVV